MEIVKLKRCVIALLLFAVCVSWQTSLSLVCAPAHADDAMHDEYKVKAVFIYNALKFTELNSAPAAVASAMNLCLLGESPFGANLDSLEGMTVKGRKLALKKVKISEIENGCEVLFICRSERDNLQNILKSANQKNVLTIGDTEGFGRKGVIVNLFLQENSVRFKVNLDAAKRSGIKFDARFLKLAVIIAGEKG